MRFGPSSIFVGKKGDPKKRDSPMSHIPSTSSSMFSMLQNSGATVEPPVSKSSRPPSRKPRVDLEAQTIFNMNTAPPLPSALATARHIEDINRITYPEGINGPEVHLNANIQKGKFLYVPWICAFLFLFFDMFPARYDRDFLLQFMNICQEKPDNPTPLGAIGLKPSDTSHTAPRGGSGRKRASNK